jgi:hypothetical protein
VGTPPEQPAELQQPPGEAPAPVPWRGWETFLVYLAQFVVAQLVLGVVAVFASKNVAIVVGVVVGELILLAATFVWVRARHHAGWRELGWTRRDVRGDLGAGVAAGIGGMAASFFFVILINLAGRALGRTFKEPDQVPLAHPGMLTVVILGLAVTIIAPIAEETFFRGFLYQSVRKWMPFAGAALWSGALFGLAHFYPLLYLPIGALGVILASTFDSRRSILPCVVAHALFNGVNFIVLARNFT